MSKKNFNWWPIASLIGATSGNARKESTQTIGKKRTEASDRKRPQVFLKNKRTMATGKFSRLSGLAGEAAAGDLLVNKYYYRKGSIRRKACKLANSNNKKNNIRENSAIET